MTCKSIISTFHSFLNVAGFFRRNARSEGAAEGGCGGNSAAPELKRSPAALLVQSRTPKKSFVFLLEEKIGRAQKENRKQNFSLEWRALASGGGAERVNFVQNRFGLCHIIALRSDFRKIDRQDWPRFARQRTETLARRERRGLPSAGSKSLAILSICFAQ